MPSPTFHDLAEQFCGIAGVPVPELTLMPGGMVAFTAKFKGVDVTVNHWPAGGPDHVFVIAVLGELPRGRELAAARQLLHANLLMLQPHSPVFSLDPADGRVLLQYVFSLVDATAGALMAEMRALVDTALRWRETFLLEPDAAGQMSSVRAATGVRV